MQILLFMKQQSMPLGKECIIQQMDGGTADSTLSKVCFLIPICAAVSRLLLQRATRLSTPGLHLDRCSVWTTYVGSRAFVHGSDQRGNPQGNRESNREAIGWSLCRVTLGELLL